MPGNHLNASWEAAAGAGTHVRLLALKLKALGKAALADSTTVQDLRQAQDSGFNVQIRDPTCSFPEGIGCSERCT